METKNWKNTTIDLGTLNKWSFRVRQTKKEEEKIAKKVLLLSLLF